MPGFSSHIEVSWSVGAVFSKLICKIQIIAAPNTVMIIQLFIRKHVEKILTVKKKIKS